MKKVSTCFNGYKKGISHAGCQQSCIAIEGFSSIIWLWKPFLGTWLHVFKLVGLRIGQWIYGQPWSHVNYSNSVKDRCNGILSWCWNMITDAIKSWISLGEQSCDMGCDCTWKSRDKVCDVAIEPCARGDTHGHL